jgi:hypothetical protein
MDPHRDLAPCLIGSGTLAHPRDMLRALETIENLEYSFTVHGDAVSQGRAALVKLMADPESSTLVVNDCLFLNVLSFRYLDFEQLSEDSWGFTLYGDGSTLRLVSLPETRMTPKSPSAHTCCLRRQFLTSSRSSFSTTRTTRTRAVRTPRQLPALILRPTTSRAFCSWVSVFLSACFSRSMTTTMSGVSPTPLMTRFLGVR